MKYLILDNNEFLTSDDYSDRPLITVKSNLDCRKVLSNFYDTINWDTLDINWTNLEISFAQYDENKNEDWKYLKLQRTIPAREI